MVYLAAFRRVFVGTFLDVLDIFSRLDLGLGGVSGHSFLDQVDVRLRNSRDDADCSASASSMSGISKLTAQIALIAGSDLSLCSFRT